MTDDEAKRRIQEMMEGGIDIGKLSDLSFEVFVELRDKYATAAILIAHIGFENMTLEEAVSREASEEIRECTEHLHAHPETGDLLSFDVRVYHLTRPPTVEEQFEMVRQAISTQLGGPETEDHYG